MLNISDFDYDLPKELIAQYPLEKRDAARLMVIDRNKGTTTHTFFNNITDYLNKSDVLIVNDTKVLPARLFGIRPSGGKVELLLLKQKSAGVFEVLIRPGRVRLKEKIIFNGGKVYAELTAKNEVTFDSCELEDIYNLGVMPLPPYIKRKSLESDKTYYQTVYARHDGSIAAPTAGLHFTEELLGRINSRGINIGYVTLHVGHSTFKPVKEEDIARHKMGLEYYRIQDQTAFLLSGEGRIIAVGTTVLRSIETYAYSGNKEGYTDLFIYPGYKFKTADCLLTNFHLPKTTLFMLVCAFAGEKFIKEAYAAAIEKKYRFYSYGDAMLII